MKILTLHSDFIEFEPKKKAFKGAEEIKKEKSKVKECLVVFTAVEKIDEKNIESSVKQYIKEIKDVAKQVKTESIVLYPYAHLSSSLANPKIALEIMQKAEKLLSKSYKVKRAPFGWYKSFNVSCKGHPLSELSREFGPEKEGKSVDKKLNDKEIKNLLKQISRSKLDTSKLKENDHRIIGQNLDLWSFNEVSPGMVFWHPKGLILKNALIEFWRDIHRKYDYVEISTPQILDKTLWLLSGHWDKFKENMFITQYEKRDFAIKPMNCPGGMLVYKSTPKSYRDLPLRVGELGIVHRQELSGVLGGLFRVIQFTQDDAHIYCTEKQMAKELEKVIELANLFYGSFGLKVDHIELSTRPAKRIGKEKMWDLAEETLEKVLKKSKIKFKINKGDGAFYGPKIDYHIKDSLGRNWQCATVQLDMSLPERFDLNYTTKDNKSKMPVMIHRTIYGSLERFLGIITEHLNGKFPLWLSPNQVKIVTINDKCVKFAEEVEKILKENGIRVESDYRNETIGKKVLEARNARFNYIVTIGEKEVKDNVLAIKPREGNLKFGVELEKFLEQLKKEIDDKKIK